jgi:hypothetical protein
MTRDQYASASDDGFAMTTKLLVSRGINVETAEEAAQADREMLEKHYLAGYTSSELGRQRGCTAVAVRVGLLRARRRIRARCSNRESAAANASGPGGRTDPQSNWAAVPRK